MFARRTVFAFAEELWLVDIAKAHRGRAARVWERAVAATVIETANRVPCLCEAESVPDWLPQLRKE